MGGAIAAFDALVSERADALTHSLAMSFEVAEADFFSDVGEGRVFDGLLFETLDFGV